MTQYKDPAEQARAAQRLAEEQQRLHRNATSGALAPDQLAGQVGRHRRDTLAHTAATEALGDALRAERLAREERQQQEGRAVVAQALRDDDAKTRVGGGEDQRLWTGIVRRQETEYLGDVVSVPPLTVLSATIRHLRRVDDPEGRYRFTYVWLEAPWEDRAVRHLFLALSDHDQPGHDALRSLGAGAIVPVRVIGEREPARWSRHAASFAGKAFVRVAAGFLGRVEVGATYAAQVTSGGRDSTSAVLTDQANERVSLTVNHPGGHAAINGLFGLKNKPGRRVAVQVTDVRLANASTIALTWAFAPGAAFR
ncbi:MAG TPA: hypothetical protein VME63_02370 [Dyella sp.]|uniref:hypothetical protein n=1 Tax=Dyella sp. TaxID=1869338 RepID=UPI002B6E72FA|nr:hypothetical protein [Dyella sp.]HTV84219.1 hypothetical protein [Dyella sp.]